MTKTKKLTTCAVLTATAVVLAMVSKVIPSPWLQGGSVTIASAVPIIMVSLLFGYRWGLLSGVTYAVIQMMTGFYPPPTQTAGYFFLVIALDYIFAFGVYGLASLFYVRNKTITIPISGIIVMTLRYLCHFLSGMLVWGVYAEEGQTVVAYSIIYNGSYMIPEIIITGVVLALLIRPIGRIEKSFSR